MGRALEVSCGPGVLLSRLTGTPFEVFGLDLSPEMITEARIRTSGFDVNLAVGQLAQLPYRDQSFDVILALGVLEYLLTPTANNTAATTITLNGNAATPIEDAFGSDLASGSLIVGNTALMFWSTDHSGLLIAAAVDGNAFLAGAQTAATPDERAPHARLLRLSHTNSNQEDFSRAKPSTLESLAR